MNTLHLHYKITDMLEEGPPQSLSFYCRKSATVKISMRPFFILQIPLISRLSFAWTPVLFRSLTRGLFPPRGVEVGTGVAWLKLAASRMSPRYPEYSHIHHEFHVFIPAL